MTLTHNNHHKTGILDVPQTPKTHKDDRSVSRTTDPPRGTTSRPCDWKDDDDDASGTESTMEHSMSSPSSSSTTTATTSIVAPMASSDSNKNPNSSRHSSFVSLHVSNNKWQRLLNRCQEQQQQPWHPRRQLSLPQEVPFRDPPKRRVASVVQQHKKQGPSIIIPLTIDGENAMNRRIKNNPKESLLPLPGESDWRQQQPLELHHTTHHPHQDLLDQCDFLFNELHLWQSMYRTVQQEHQATKTELGNVQRQREWLFQQVRILEKCMMGFIGEEAEANDSFDRTYHQGDGEEARLTATTRVDRERPWPREGRDKDPEPKRPQQQQPQPYMGGQPVAHWKARAEVLEQQMIWFQEMLQNALEARTLQSSKIQNGTENGGQAISTQRIKKDLQPYIQQKLLLK